MFILNMFIYYIGYILTDVIVSYINLSTELLTFLLNISKQLVTTFFICFPSNFHWWQLKHDFYGILLYTVAIRHSIIPMGAAANANAVLLHDDTDVCKLLDQIS